MSGDYIVEKDWTYKGYKCAVLFVNNSHRCGYVGFKSDHPLFGCEYDKPTPILAKMWKKVRHEALGKRGIFAVFTAASEDGGHRPDVIFNVHGGITFSVLETEYPIKTEEPTFWYGYDCAHAGDKTSYSFLPGDVERSLEYCIGECESLADQLEEVK